MCNGNKGKCLEIKRMTRKWQLMWNVQEIKGGEQTKAAQTIMLTAIKKSKIKQQKNINRHNSGKMLLEKLNSKIKLIINKSAGNNEDESEAMSKGSFSDYAENNDEKNKNSAKIMTQKK